MTEKQIFENDSVIPFFGNEHSLISSEIKAINIHFFEEILTIDIDLKLQYSKNDKNFRLRFSDVIEYSFYHNSNYYFYNVVNVKFFKINDLYYLSLDPDESCISKSDNDNDFILGKKLQAFEITH